MTAETSEELAGLLAEANSAPRRIRSMFGTILTVGTGTVTIRPDSTATGSMGPLAVVAGKGVVGNRVLCLYLPDNEVWVVVAR